VTFRVYLSLGSNINPRSNISRTVESLGSLSSVESISNVYRTEPVRVESGADDFHNLCLETSVEWKPPVFKEKLRDLESKVGRVREENNNRPHQSRRVDVDILIYEPEPHEFIPHPQIYDEAFVVFPLSDIYDPSRREDLPGSVRSWRSGVDRSTVKDMMDYDWPEGLMD